MTSHKSKSGPVKVVERFEPVTLTISQQRARLRHKLALLEDRIAARTSFNASLRNATVQLDELLLQKAQTEAQIATLESGE